jgi:transmembrane sensor
MTGAREKRIRREAAQWVVKFDGEFNPADVRPFRRWLSRSDEHRAAFQHSSATWNQLDLLSRLEAYPLPADAAPAVDRRVLLAGGAASLLALGAGAYVTVGAGAAEAFETGVGEVRDITLSDGTTVALNAGTRVEARIRPASRSARVVRGEALFNIVAASGETFALHTVAGGVEALSGEVLVKVLPDGVRVSLMSGQGRAWRAGFISREGRVVIEPHSEIELGDGDLSVTRIEAPLESRRTLWREGRLAFDDTPLSEAVADVSRQTGVQFEFADPALADLRVGGLINARDLDAFQLMLRQNLAVDARRRGDGVIELSSTATFGP